MFDDFLQKIGVWPNDLTQAWKDRADWIWFHAVSVGEFNAIYPLIELIHNEKSNYPIMISCTTKAGYTLARSKTKDERNIVVFYFPFDIPLIVSSLLKKVSIKLLVIAETEIWPTTLSKCNLKNIPVVLINGRISDKSFKNYYLLRFYFKNIVNLFTEILTQSQKDAEKFIAIGAEKEKVKVFSNLKFSTGKKSLKINGKMAESIDSEDTSTTKIIFASTHKGEEEIALNSYKKLSSKYPKLRLIIAPRHLNRIKEIKLLINKNGYKEITRSSGRKISSKNDIYLLDTIGELQDFYKKAKITVLGGTFAKIGGHNILEPIRANSYTIIGPNDFKIKELSTIFKDKNAITPVNNTSELTAKIEEALEDSELINTKIANGKKIIQENENITKQITEHIYKYL